MTWPEAITEVADSAAFAIVITAICWVLRSIMGK